MRVLLSLLAVTSIQFSLFAPVVSAELKAVDLRTEYRVDPRGVDDAKPRLYWRVTSDERGQEQTAYRVIAASTRDGLKQGKADLWDSGKVASSKSIHIEYAGKVLSSRQQCFLGREGMGSRRRGVRLEHTGVMDDGTALRRRLVSELHQLSRPDARVR